MFELKLAGIFKQLTFLEDIMDLWHVVLGVLVFLLLCVYIVLTYSQKLSAESLSEPPPVSLSDEQAIRCAQSVKRDIQAIHYWQCAIMIILTLVFALVDTHYFVMVSMLTVSLAAGHYYFGKKIIP